jgi:glycosyltransferase involved in cell wall biosynthesis
MRRDMNGHTRVLVISYAFPPVGGAGVQRVSKLVKYLPYYGVVPSVLTVGNASVPLRDPSLERDLPEGVEIVRAPTLEPGYGAKRLAWTAAADDSSAPFPRLKRKMVAMARGALGPDPQVLWLPGSARALVRRFRSDGADDVIFISGPPFSQFLLAPLVRLRPGTALVLDYRDEWTTTRAAYEMGAGASDASWLESAVLRRADAVTTATEEFRESLLARFPFLDPARVHTIPNGYDPDDFSLCVEKPPADRFVLTYVGTVFRLTSARGLLEGIRCLRRRAPDLAKLLDVRFIGRIVETEAKHFEGCEELGVTRQGYLEHSRAMAALGGSHAALCLLEDLPGAERICPAKIFEILFLGRPCLAIAPDGALARLVRRYGLGEVIHPRDSDTIADTLASMLRGFRSGHPVALRYPTSLSNDISRFHRRRQAGEFAGVFRSAIRFARERNPIRAPLAHPWRRGAKIAS